MFNSSKNVKRFVSISAAAACIFSSLHIAPLDNFTVGLPQGKSDPV